MEDWEPLRRRQLGEQRRLDAIRGAVTADNNFAEQAAIKGFAAKWEETEATIMIPNGCFLHASNLLIEELLQPAAKKTAATPARPAAALASLLLALQPAGVKGLVPPLEACGRFCHLRALQQGKTCAVGVAPATCEARSASAALAGGRHALSLSPGQFSLLQGAGPARCIPRAGRCPSGSAAIPEEPVRCKPVGRARSALCAAFYVGG